MPVTLPTPVTITDPVGVDEIARRLGVSPLTPHKWRQRGILPLPAFVVSRCPVWEWSTVETWARETNRLPQDRPAPADAASDPDSYAADILSRGSWR